MTDPAGSPDSRLVTAGAVGFAVGILLGWAAAGARGQRGREVRELVDHLVDAAREGLLSRKGSGPALDEAIHRLRALGERVRGEGPT